MTFVVPKKILVTGANAGIGLEAARQLALKDSTKKVILGCRNQERAEKAKLDLEEDTGKKDIFEILIIDVMDFDSVKRAVSGLSEPLDGVILNAGGPGGKDISAMTKDGVTNIMAVNVTGHALLVEELILQKKLMKGSTVIYSSSEAARGVPSFNFPKPTIESGSVEEFQEAIDGSKFVKLKDQTYETMYSFAKLIGALWSAGMSRKSSEFRFVAVTPGMTTGTNITKDLHPLKRAMFNFIGPIFKFLGMGHGVDIGAKRYLDAMYDFETQELYQTGNFYGSIEGLTGTMGNQVQFFDALANECFQDNAHEAVYSFIK